MPAASETLAIACHVRHLPVEVHGDHCRGVRGDGRGDVVRGQQQRLRIDVDEHRDRAHRDDCLDGRHERVAGHDDLAPAELERLEDQRERVGAVRDTDAVGHAAIGGELGFERLDVPTSDERVRRRDASPDAVELGTDLVVLRGEIEKRNGTDRRRGHAVSPSRTRGRSSSNLRSATSVSISGRLWIATSRPACSALVRGLEDSRDGEPALAVGAGWRTRVDALDQVRVLDGERLLEFDVRRDDVAAPVRHRRCGRGR